MKKTDWRWLTTKNARKNYSKPELQDRFIYLFNLYLEKRHLISKNVSSIHRLGEVRLFKNYTIDGTNILQKGRMGGYRGAGKSPVRIPSNKFLERKFDKDELIEGIINLNDYEYLFSIFDGSNQPQEITKISNATLRREALNFYGVEKFFKNMKTQKIHQDGKNELLTLRWHGGETPITMVKVIDSTTKDVYLLRVPPDMKTVRQAIAWTFHMKEKEYHPVKET